MSAADAEWLECLNDKSSVDSVPFIGLSLLPTDAPLSFLPDSTLDLERYCLHVRKLNILLMSVLTSILKMDCTMGLAAMLVSRRTVSI